MIPIGGDNQGNDNPALKRDAFLKLLSFSPSVKQMDPAHRNRMYRLAYTPDTPEAQSVYMILIEEKSRLEDVEKNFQKTIVKISDDLAAGIEEAKEKVKKDRVVKMRKGTEKGEQKAAESLLKKL